MDTCHHYYLPKVILNMCSTGPLYIHSNNIVINEYIKKLNLTGETIILPHVKHGQRSFPIAEIADESEPMRELSESANNVHHELSSVIASLIDDFEQAAEEFLFSLAKDIGLKPAEQKHPKVIEV